jgi:antitoxin VapB
MQTQPTAKLFATGGSQAVRLPAEFRFEGESEVYIRREPTTGDVVLSRRPHAAWSAFMARRAELADDTLADFLRDRQQPPVQERAPLGGKTEKRGTNPARPPEEVATAARRTKAPR